MNIHKICTSCNRDLPASAFRKQRKAKDGLQYECKACTSARAEKRYSENKDSILDKNKEWQSKNTDKHNSAALKYYHSPTARMARNLNKRLNDLLGNKRESFFHLVGVTPSALMIHLATLLPESFTLEEYGAKWIVVFSGHFDYDKAQDEDYLREFFNWKNLEIKIKSNPDEDDFGV